MIGTHKRKNFVYFSDNSSRLHLNRLLLGEFNSFSRKSMCGNYFEGVILIFSCSIVIDRRK